MNIKGIIVKTMMLVTVLLFVWGCSSTSFFDSFGVDSEKESTPAQKEAEDTEPINELTASSGEGLIGTWINTDYNNDNRSAMVVYDEKSNGNLAYTAYDNTDGSGNSYQGMIEITEVWTDPEGRTVMNSIVDMTGGMSWKTITRMGSDGSMIEVQSGTKTIDPDGPQYSLYYRK